MSLIRFLQIIETSPIGVFFATKLRLIDSLNPDRIYVENIRSIYNLPTFAAKFFCEMAVAEGIFRKRIGVECLNEDCGRIILSVADKEDVPESVNCTNCELLEKPKYHFNKDSLNKVTFYQLVR